MSSPTKLGEIVTRNSVLRQLIEHAAVHKAFDRRIKLLIDEPLRSHFHVTGLRDDNLVLTADSSAWAARLRYQVPEIHRLIRESSDFPKVQAIRIKTAASQTHRRTQPTRKPLPLSAASVAELQNCAQRTDDPALRDVLLRLKRHST